MADFDFSEVTQLAADLGDVAAETVNNLGPALEFTSFRIKQGAARKVSSRRHFGQAAAAIDYELNGFSGFGAAVVQAEIGYDKHRPAGELGNLVEFGAPGSPNALSPGSELVSTLHEEEADFVRGIERAIADAHRGAGL